VGTNASPTTRAAIAIELNRSAVVSVVVPILV
jgi:hypothetical protein